MYNLKPSHLRRIKAALGRARGGTGDARIAYVDDSTVGGVGASPVGQRSWPEQMSKMLMLSGIPIKEVWVAGYKSSAKDDRWTFGSGWNALSGASNLIFNRANANPATFVSTAVGTIVRVYYANSGGPFSVAIDGGSPVTVTPVGGNSLGIYEATGLPASTHTVTIARVSGNAQIFGASVVEAANGLRVLNAGIGGTKATPSSGLGWFTTEALATAAAGFNADAMFLMMQTNDSPDIAGAGGTVLATFKANMQAMITAARGGSPDIALVTAVPSGNKDFTGTRQVLYQLTDENDLPLVDLGFLYGSYAQQNSYGLMSDNLHPNAAGYAQVARTNMVSLAL